MTGGYTPNVILCDGAAPCEGFKLDRVRRTGWLGAACHILPAIVIDTHFEL
jgi:hypothetical protein